MFKIFIKKTISELGRANYPTKQAQQFSETPAKQTFFD